MIQSEHVIWSSSLFLQLQYIHNHVQISLNLLLDKCIVHIFLTELIIMLKLIWNISCLFQTV